TFESAMLGYRISLPFGYRQLPAGFNDGRGPAMGNDYYTPQTEQQARDACNKDAGDLGSRESTKDIRIEVYRDAATPLVQWALEPPRNLAFSSALAATHDGLEAARVVYTPSGELESYVVRANGRIYLLSPGIWEMPSS